MSLENFSFSLNLLKICPWWNVTFMIPFFFVLIISSYYLFSSASLFKSSNARFSSMIMEFNNCFLSLLLINVLPFYYLPHLSISINKKIITIVPNLKQKCLSKLIFFASLKTKKITSSTVILSFSYSSF